MKILTVTISAFLLVGCSTTYKKYNFGELGENYWNNHAFLHLSRSEFQLEFSKVKGACNVEAYKLHVPSPSCVQPPQQVCTGKTGFALGFCRSQIPSMQCDYSSVNIAKQARNEIYNSCMQANGWQLEWVRGAGTDVSGGIFEYVAFDNNNEYFIRLYSVARSGDLYFAVIRQSAKNSSGKSYQGVYVFNIKDNTLKVDNENPVKIEKGSAAEFLLKRVKQLA